MQTGSFPHHKIHSLRMSSVDCA